MAKLELSTMFAAMGQVDLNSGRIQAAAALTPAARQTQLMGQFAAAAQCAQWAQMWAMSQACAENIALRQHIGALQARLQHIDATSVSAASGPAHVCGNRCDCHSDGEHFTPSTSAASSPRSGSPRKEDMLLPPPGLRLPVGVRGRVGEEDVLSPPPGLPLPVGFRPPPGLPHPSVLLAAMWDESDRGDGAACTPGHAGDDAPTLPAAFDWRIEKVFSKLKASSGFPIVSSEFRLGPCDGVRVQFCAGNGWAVSGRNPKRVRARAKCEAVTAERALDDAAQNGCLKLKYNGVEAPTPFRVALEVGGIRRGPFLCDFANTGVQEFPLDFDWRQHLEPGSGCLRLRLEPVV